MKHRYLITLLLAAGAHQVYAQPAYRSVDEQGNITFSDAPVPGAAEETRIKIDAPTPSTAEVQESRQQAAEMLDAASQTTETSAAPSQAAQRQAAQRAVQEAEQQLEAAREVREGDRIGTASGGSRLTPEYLERVRMAEEQVDRARKQLEATK
jgi:hypothetical protein